MSAACARLGHAWGALLVDLCGGRLTQVRRCQRCGHCETRAEQVLP